MPKQISKPLSTRWMKKIVHTDTFASMLAEPSRGSHSTT
jgi:hypothetical protein